ncbi:MAG: pitrilysin family protein [Pseudomonadota bacterium]
MSRPLPGTHASKLPPAEPSAENGSRLQPASPFVSRVSHRRLMSGLATKMVRSVIAGAMALGAISVGLLSQTGTAKAVDVQRVVSPGGIEAWLVEDRRNPIIALNLSFLGGAASDPASKEGVANFVAATIDEGAGDLDSQAFQRRLEDLSISLSFSDGRETFGGSLSTLSENADQAFELLRLALTEPRFDQEPVERIRRQILAGLTRDLDDPNYWAARGFWAAFYPDHPYGRTTRGTLETVPDITSDDLRAHMETRLGRDTLKIGVVGDIDAETLAGYLDKTFLGLPETTPVKVAVTPVPAQASGDTFVLRKEIPQSVALFGHGGIARDDPDYYAAYAMNYILGGGGFASRLYREVREKKGLAYSVYSYLAPLDSSAVYVGGVATQNSRLGESLSIIRAEWERMRTEGPSAEELADAKTYLTGSFPLRLSSSGQIAGMLVGMQRDDLGIDYLDRRNQLIEKITLDDVKRMAQSLLDPDALTFIVVGQPDGVESTAPAPVSGF